jgi:hypothetical protein
MPVNRAHRVRQPYRNSGGGPSVKQKNYVRLLERQTGSKEHDLKGMSKAELSDYIATLQHRKVKQETLNPA